MTRRYVDHYLADLTAMVTTLNRDFAALERRLLVWSRDGYLTGTNGTIRSSQLSDPTATAVLTPDHVRNDRDRIRQLIVEAHETLKEADLIRTKYMTPAQRVDAHNLGLTKCGNVNGCPDGMFAAKAGRCLSCYEYRRLRNDDRLPPRDHRKSAQQPS
jgi:hypothetical protein